MVVLLALGEETISGCGSLRAGTGLSAVCPRPLFNLDGDVADSQLRASNEGLLRPRVARAQRVNQGAYFPYTP